MAVTSAQVQELYVALLGRAADKAGLDYWVSQINAEGSTLTLENVRANFVNEQAEYAAIYGDLTRAELVSTIYSNLFERTPSAAEVDYWVKDGVSADQLVVAFLSAASTADRTVVANKTLVAQYYTDAAGGDFDQAAAAAIIAEVNGSSASVGTALQNLPVSNATLTSALGVWESANEAKQTFLAGLDLDKDAATATVAADVEALITAAPGTPVALFNANQYSTADLSASSTAAQQNSAYVAARAAFDVAVVAQQAEVADAQAAVTALNDVKDVNAYIAAVNAAAVTEAALVPAEAAAAGAVASYNLLNSSTVSTADYSVTTGTAAIAGSSGLEALAKLNTSGAVVAKAGVTEETNPGITSLLSAVNADIAAQVNDYKADQAVGKAADLVGSGSQSGLVDTLIAEKANLVELQKDAAKLEALISDVKDAFSLNAKLEALNSDVGDAFDAISAGTTLTVDLLDATNTPTAGSDLFIFNSESANVDAGFAADDRLFIGSSYSLIELGDSQTVGTTSLGNAGALEVIWDASTSTLFVEKEAFSGNAQGLDNFETIVLTGVTGDLQLAGGFVQLA